MGGQLVHCPPEINLWPLLRKLSSPAIDHSPEYRRAITRTDPLAFAMVYLIDHLRSDETAGRLSFNQFHLDVAYSARRWIRDDLAPAELREAWIAPRGSAKTTWLFLILPLWAMAHGHQRFIMAFSNAAKQAQGHLGTLTRELATNPLLQIDYPELCTPTTANAELYLATTMVPRPGGKAERVQVAIAAKGIDSSTLGVKIGRQRPTCLLLDDIEPDASNYDSTTKRNRLSTITNAVFPMALNAVVQWAATVTAAGSLSHDLVKSVTGQGTAAWIREHNVKVRYYPAIVADAEGNLRSMWPQRWTLDFLLGIRNTQFYQLNYANNPVNADGTFWTREMFRIDPRFPISEGLLSIDPAVTSRETSDFTGYAVVARDASGRRVCVTSARGIKVSPQQLGEEIAATCDRNPWITKVILEGNQGGDTWAAVLRPYIPTRVKLETYYAHEAKTVRYAAALEHYENPGRVVHARAIPAFEEQALACPNLVNDDVLDVVTAGVRYYLDPVFRQ